MRARSLIAIVLAALATALALVAPQGASAAKVANPGPFNATVTDGFLRIGDNQFGFDPQNPITFNGTIDSGGVINIPTSGMNFPAMPVSAGGFDLTVRINPAAAITGNLNPLTGEANLRLRVWIKIDGVPLGGGCRVASSGSPIDVNALITGTTNPPGPNGPITGTPYSYNESNNTNATLKVVNNNFAVPSASDCGLANGTVNGELGLPSAAGNNEAQFQLGISPTIRKGITAQLNTSGTSGVRPYTVNFDASGSTRTAALRHFQWDFDGNGTFDQTTSSPTTSFTYLNAGTYQAKVRHVDVDGDFAEATRTITVANPPDLSIDSTHTDPFRVGTPAHYDLDVRNVSNGPTLGTVTVTDVVPNGLTITGVSGAGWSCATAAQTVTCTRPSLAGNATAPNIRIDVAPTVAALPGGQNAASVSSPGDTNPANNTDLDQTTVTAIDLAIDKSHQGTFRPGNGPTNVYTLDVENAGTAATIGPVTVTDTLPAGLTPTSASGAGWTCNIVGATVTCTRATPIAGGDSAPPITIAVDAAAPTEGTSYEVTNTASVGTATDAYSENNSDSDDTLVIDSPDAAVTKSHQGNLTAGSQATYTIAVDNDGPQPTTGPTTVTDTLPAGLTFVSASGTGWDCSAVGQDVTCLHADPIAADGSAADIELVATVGLEAIPSVTNTATVDTEGDDNPANDSSSDPAIVRAIDLKITKSHENALRLGDEGAFQIDVENIGDSPTVDPAVVTDALPAGLTYAGFSGNGWDCSAAGQDVTCTHADEIADGAAADTLELRVDVGPDALPGVSNTASVDTTDDYNPDNDSSTDEAPVVEIDASVAISRTGSFRSESTGTYLIAVDNEGVAPTTGETTVEVTLPEGLSFDSADSSNDEWACSEAAGVVTCTYADPIGSDTAVPDIQLRVNIAANAPDSVTTTATVSTADDRNPDNDTASDTATVTGPDLTVDSAHTGDFTVGGEGTYTIAVDNIGSDATRGVTTVTDTLPAGLDFDDANGPGWDCAESSAVVTCTRDSEIPAGGSAPDIELDVDVTPAAGPTVDNVVTVDTVGDRNPDNDTDSDFTQIRRIDLRISLDRNGPAVVGSEVGYEIGVDNVGDATTIAPIRVEDTLPAGIVPDDAAGSGWDCAVTGQKVTCTRDAALAPTEQTGAIEIDAAVTPAAADTVVNEATVSTTGDAEPSNDTDSDEVTLTRTPDLSVTLDDQIDQNDSVTVGDEVEYKLTLRNEGGSPTSQDSQLSMELGEGLEATGTDLSDAAGWTCTVNGRLVDCTAPAGIPSAPDQGSRQTIVVTASASQDAGDETETVATVNTTGDSDSSDDTARVVSKVTRIDLAIAKNFGAGPWTAGRQATYDLRVTDLGTAPSSGPAVVREQLPTGVSLAAAQGPGWECRGVADELICSHAGAITPSQTKRIVVTVDVGDSAVPGVSSEATVSTDKDVNAANDSSSDSVEVVERPEDREFSKVGARLAMKKARVTRNGIVHIRLGCPKTAENGCTGEVELSSVKKVKGGKGGKAKRVSFGATPFEITQGHTLPVPIHLTDRSRAILKRAGSLMAKVTVSPTGLKSSSYKLELRSRR